MMVEFHSASTEIRGRKRRRRRIRGKI